MLCFCSGSRRKFATRTTADRGLRIPKAFAAVGLRSLFLWDVVQCRHIPDECVATSQKNASMFPEEFVATFQKNASPIPEERIDTSQNN